MLAAYPERSKGGRVKVSFSAYRLAKNGVVQTEREVTRMWKTWDLWMTFAKNVQGWLRACVYTLDRHTSPMANDVVAVFKPRALPGPQQ
jgi:hypothetical protein